MRTRIQALVATVAAAAFVALMWLAPPEGPQPAQAMPTFSQALGVGCQTCHTMVPSLNAYGRYVARTFYQAINNKQARSTLPIWIWEEINGSSTGAGDSRQPSKKMTIGNLMLYFAGFAGPEFTYRVENGIWSGDQATNQSTGPETMWLAYHGLFNGYGHVQVGFVYPGPVPPFLNFAAGDHETPFAIRHITVGTHGYNLINDRLTFRFNYEKGPIDLEAAWRGGTHNPIGGGPSDFEGPGIDKAIQWLAGYAPPTRPWEFGAFGIVGTYALKGTFGTPIGPPNIDRYNMWAPYFDIDPNWVRGAPGLYAFYATSHDSNPGIFNYTLAAPEGPHATDEAVELWQTFFKGLASVSVRQETINNGLGAFSRYYAMGMSAEPIPSMPYIFVRFMVPMDRQSSAPSGRPGFLWSLQYLGPISGPLTNPFTRRTSVSQAAPAGSAGEALYAANCSACHGANGQGQSGTFPALAGSAAVTAADPTALITLVKHGAGTMPAYGTRLSDADIAALLTYIRSTWGNNASAVTEAQVTGIR